MQSTVANLVFNRNIDLNLILFSKLTLAKTSLYFSKWIFIIALHKCNTFLSTEYLVTIFPASMNYFREKIKKIKNDYEIGKFEVCKLNVE